MATTTKRAKGRADDRDSYLELVREFPLKVIKTSEAHDAAMAMLAKLGVRGDDALDEGELAYMEALARFVADYEDAHHRVDLSSMTAGDVLNHLIQSGATTAAELNTMLGQSTASAVRTGKRGLSKENAKRLAERFKVDVALFV